MDKHGGGDNMMVGQAAHLEDYSRKTIQDCIDKLQYEKQATILHNGEVTGFEEETNE